MGYDRTGICPNCAKIQEEKIKDARQIRDASYGNVPQDVYQQLDKKYYQLLTENLPESLGETWDMTTMFADGQITMIYNCVCRVCKMERRWKQSINIANMDDVRLERMRRNAAVRGDSL